MARIGSLEAGATTNVVRICFFIVWVVNIQCAIGFIASPDGFAGAYQLAGVPGRAAVQGIGVAFLMWNATYPPFIFAPRRFVALGWVIIAQQLIGLCGETFILAGIGGDAAFALLASSIQRFILFDAAGLLVMVAALLLFVLAGVRKPRDGR